MDVSSANFLSNCEDQLPPFLGQIRIEYIRKLIYIRPYGIISQTAGDGAKIAVANKYEVARDLTIGIFTFDLRPF